MTQTEFEKMLVDRIKAALEEQRVAITNAISSEIEAKVKDFYASQKDTKRPKLAEDGAPAETENRFKNLGEQLQAVRKAATGIIDPRLKAPTGLGEDSDAAGGFLVQSDFATELIKRTHDTGVLSRRCRRIPISAGSNSLIINGVDEKSRANGSRYGGIQVYWTDEAATVTASKPAFRQIELKLKKLTGAYYATDEVLADTTALQSLCMDGFSEEFGFKVDDAILAGNGGGQPLGVTKSGCLIAVAKEAGQAADTIVTENVMKMINRMDVRSRAKAEWFYNIDCEPQFMQMVLTIGTGGVPVFLPANGISGAPLGTLYARPMNPLEQCEALGDQGDILLGDFGQYLLIEKGGIAASESIHVMFLFGESVFKFVYRVDGQPKFNAPLSPYKGVTTTSPFVTLAARA